MTDKSDGDADWSLATWEGAQRESLRRWAKLPLENIIAALEEMQALNEVLHGSDVSVVESRKMDGVQERGGKYTSAKKHFDADKKK